MRTIYKYALSSEEPTTILDIPSDSLVHHVGIQNGLLCLWIGIGDTDEPEQRVTYRVFHTGEKIPKADNHEWSWEHVGTVVDESFEWHVHEMFHL